MKGPFARYATWCAQWDEGGIGRSREFDTRAEAEAFRPSCGAVPRVLFYHCREGCATPEGRARFDLMNPIDIYAGGHQ